MILDILHLSFFIVGEVLLAIPHVSLPYEGLNAKSICIVHSNLIFCL